jgi:hypothetical protein
MTKFEWVNRCQMQLAKKTQDFSYDWREAAEVCFVENYDYFENDPEGSADFELTHN